MFLFKMMESGFFGSNGALVELQLLPSRPLDEAADCRGPVPHARFPWRFGASWITIST